MFFIIPEHKYSNRKSCNKELFSDRRRFFFIKKKRGGNKNKETAIQSCHKVTKVEPGYPGEYFVIHMHKSRTKDGHICSTVVKFSVLYSVLSCKVQIFSISHEKHIS